MLKLMNKFILMFALIVFSGFAFAGFNICPDETGWSVCPDAAELDAKLNDDIDLSDVLRMNGFDTGDEPTFIASGNKNIKSNDMTSYFNVDLEEVGWQS